MVGGKFVWQEAPVASAILEYRFYRITSLPSVDEVEEQLFVAYSPFLSSI